MNILAAFGVLCLWLAVLLVCGTAGSQSMKRAAWATLDVIFHWAIVAGVLIIAGWSFAKEVAEALREQREKDRGS